MRSSKEGWSACGPWNGLEVWEDMCVFSLCIVGLGGKDIEPTCR